VCSSDLVQACKDLFRNQINNNSQAWDALGGGHQQRLEQNYVTWVRRYMKPGTSDRSYSADELTRRPIAWSVGGFSPIWAMISNVRVAQRAGIEIEIFKGRHFPQVEIPDFLASHIRKHTRQHFHHEQLTSA
jgi:hypothetical protein